MGMIERVADFFKEMYEAGSVPRNEYRSLNEGDREAWYEAQDKRQGPKFSTIEQVRAHLKKRNAPRYFDLMRQYKWLKKEMVKMGLNPEDARYIL